MSAYVYLAILLGFLFTLQPGQSTLAADDLSETEIDIAKSAQAAPSEPSATVNLLVLLGVVESLHQELRSAIADEVLTSNVEYLELVDIHNPTFSWPDADQVIATGVTGCKVAAQAPINVPVVCAFITAEKYAEIYFAQNEQTRQNLTAIVSDQPVSRQVAIATTIYPALSRFAVLLPSGRSPPADENSDILFSEYRPDRALATQLGDVTYMVDALLATPETAIFNRSTLRTVLLTAYGYGKPVVGYSSAYVKAGALITAYSSPAQVIRQIAELTDLFSTSLSDALLSNSMLRRDLEFRVLSPKYFSIVDNPSVAKSLGLIKKLDFSADISYEDKDFEP
ncbi:MAG: hypothetical protein AB8B79_11310 [Granulosicoccus sp.]